jgi:hypothetical protein
MCPSVRCGLTQLATLALIVILLLDRAKVVAVFLEVHQFCLAVCRVSHRTSFLLLLARLVFTPRGTFNHALYRLFLWPTVCLSPLGRAIAILLTIGRIATLT